LYLTAPVENSLLPILPSIQATPAGAESGLAAGIRKHSTSFLQRIEQTSMTRADVNFFILS